MSDLSVYCLPLLLSLWLVWHQWCVCAPAGLIITPRFSACQFTVQTPLKNFPRCHVAEGFLFPLPLSFPSFFFVLFSSLLCFKCVDVMCVGGWGGQWSWQLRPALLWALIETYCQSDKSICMRCVFQDVLFSAAHHSVNQLTIIHMKECTHTHTHTHTHTVSCI